jgi:DNA repair protein RecN (Recombination protein N)
MGDARVTVEVAQSEGLAHELCVDGARLSSTGVDRVEFLIAPNRGEDPKPLRRIASGGELSRAMLALKRVLAGLGPGGLYVFDEVDAGVGGAVAEVIGRKLREVAQHHQVLCITHLPQIAVFAAAHFHASKSVEAGRTRSGIRRMDESEQRDEIARMLGGIKITDKTRAAAREMLRAAK